MTMCDPAMGVPGGERIGDEAHDDADVRAVLRSAHCGSQGGGVCCRFSWQTDGPVEALAGVCETTALSDGSAPSGHAGASAAVRCCDRAAEATLVGCDRVAPAVMPAMSVRSGSATAARSSDRRPSAPAADVTATVSGCGLCAASGCKGLGYDKPVTLLPEVPAALARVHGHQPASTPLKALNNAADAWPKHPPALAATGVDDVGRLLIVPSSEGATRSSSVAASTMNIDVGGDGGGPLNTCHVPGSTKSVLAVDVADAGSTAIVEPGASDGAAAADGTTGSVASGRNGEVLRWCASDERRAAAAAPARLSCRLTASTRARSMFAHRVASHAEGARSRMTWLVQCRQNLRLAKTQEV